MGLQIKTISIPHTQHPHQHGNILLKRCVEEMAIHGPGTIQKRTEIVRTERNRAAKSRIKTLRKKTLTAIAAGDKEAAAKASSEFSSAVDKAAKRNLIHPNKAANLKSKTSKSLAAIA